METLENKQKKLSKTHKLYRYEFWVWYNKVVDLKQLNSMVFS